MEVDIIEEIKSLDKCIIKTLFNINKTKKLKIHPRPLQMAILDYLLNHEKDEIHQKDLEKNFNISKAAISSVLKTMKKNGLIERVSSENDARVNIIKVTDESKELHEKLLEDINYVNKNLKKCLTEEEMEMFLKISNKLKNYMKEGF